MAAESQQTLVAELAGMFESHVRRQAELLACLRALRTEVEAMMPVSFPPPRVGAPPSPRRAQPRPGRYPAPPRLRTPALRAGLIRSPRPLPTPAVAAARPTGPPLAAHPGTSGPHPDVVVGAPGHAPTRDYNYFAELDDQLSRRRPADEETPA